MIKDAAFILAVLAILSCAHAGSARAATISIQPRATAAIVGQKYTVDLMIDSGADAINAVSGEVTFPANALSLSSLGDGDSIINLWVVRPHADDDNAVYFSGIIPGGYRGGKGLLLSLTFNVAHIGSGEILVSSTTVLKNDGLGTAASVIGIPLPISSTASSIARTDDEVDDGLPLPFTVTVAKDPNIFAGAYFITFAATDKGSGIDHYEVKEGGAAFERAESPYLIADQTLSTPVLVAAVDKAGNRRIEAYKPPSHGISDIVLALALLVCMLLLYLGKKYVGKKSLHDYRHQSSR